MAGLHGDSRARFFVLSKFSAQGLWVQNSKILCRAFSAFIVLLLTSTYFVCFDTVM